MFANGLWKSIEPVGLRRRVGLLLAGGEPMARDAGRLMCVLRSSAPLRDPDKEDEEFIRKERRSKRDPPDSVPALRSPNSFNPAVKRSFEVSGRELVRNTDRWAFPFSCV